MSISNSHDLNKINFLEDIRASKRQIFNSHSLDNPKSVLKENFMDKNYDISELHSLKEVNNINTISNDSVDFSRDMEGKFLHRPIGHGDFCLLCQYPKESHASYNIENGLENALGNISKILENIKIEGVNDVPLNDDKTCEICSSKINSDELEEITIGCSHYFCKECYAEYLKEKIKSANVADINCMNSDCAYILQENFILNMIKDQQDLVEKYHKFLERNRVFQLNQSLRYCPFPDCEGYALRNFDIDDESNSELSLKSMKNKTEIPNEFEAKLFDSPLFERPSSNKNSIKNEDKINRSFVINQRNNDDIYSSSKKLSQTMELPADLGSVNNITIDIPAEQKVPRIDSNSTGLKIHTVKSLQNFNSPDSKDPFRSNIPPKIIYNDYTITCTKGHKFCYKCLRAPHPYKPCKANLNKSVNFDAYKEEKKLKKCPRCKWETEKNKGCNHMTCAVCRFQWCWLCEKEYKEGHYNNGPCAGLQFDGEESVLDIDEPLDLHIEWDRPRRRRRTYGIRDYRTYFRVFDENIFCTLYLFFIYVLLFISLLNLVVYVFAGAFIAYGFYMLWHRIRYGYF